jgi:hypothetical protein
MKKLIFITLILSSLRSVGQNIPNFILICNDTIPLSYVKVDSNLGLLYEKGKTGEQGSLVAYHDIRGRQLLFSILRYNRKKWASF